MVEDAAEVAGDGVDGVLHGWSGMDGAPIGFEIEAGNGAIGDAAGNDEVEVTKIGGDVEGESVGGDAAGDVNADRRDFLLLDGSAGEGPDAGASGDALSRDAEVGTGQDQGFFEATDVVDGSKARGEAAEVEDRVADELTRAMVSDVASAIDFVDFHAATDEELV